MKFQFSKVKMSSCTNSTSILRDKMKNFKFHRLDLSKIYEIVENLILKISNKLLKNIIAKCFKYR